MEGGPTLVHRFDPQTRISRRYRTSISLHSHTMHSKEYLGRLPTHIAKFPVGSYILEREIGRLHLYEERVFNFKKYYWTPPLSQFTGTRFHRVIDKFSWVIGLATNQMLRPALRLPFLGNEEGGI